MANNPLKSLKDLIEIDRKNIERKKGLSLLFIVIFLSFLFAGFTFPKIDYEDFCRDHTINPTMENGFKNPVDVFKFALCKTSEENTDRVIIQGKEFEVNFDVLAADYVLYMFYFGMKSFLFFLAAIHLTFFLKKNKFTEIMFIACSLFYWTISFLIYLSTYTGWF